MPRNARIDVGNEVYHVINRANGRLQIFSQDADYQLFEQILSEAKNLVDMRIIAYIIMPNHFHLILYPKKDGDLGIFMHKLSNSHTRKVHALTNTNATGHLYQGRYKSFLVEKDSYLFSVIKYVERNPVRAKLVKKVEDWKWGSAWRRIYGSSEQKKILDIASFGLPDDYLKSVNTEDKLEILDTVRTSLRKGVPYGRDNWVDKMIKKYKLESTLNEPGRPKKK
ncbi:MAG: transposase [Candidatus Nomurabacteria bacterium]|nr:transposase [Candidatus Nomurabacteria bacterium]